MDEINLIALELEEARKILIEIYGRDCLSEAILNAKKKDWFNICKIDNKNYIILNPKYNIDKEAKI